MKFSVTLTAVLPVVFKKRKNRVVASCPIFDVASQGETEEEAKDNLIEALTLFFISCHARNTLDQILKECGFLPDAPIEKHPAFEPNLLHIEVPFPFTHNSEQVACHV